MRQERTSGLESGAEVPSIQEVERAIEDMHNNKSAGINDIPAELYKNGGQALTQIVHKLIIRIWMEEKVPNKWKTGIICPV